jgi:hypothetical protein
MVTMPVSLRAARNRDNSAALGERRRRLSSVKTLGVKTNSDVANPANDTRHNASSIQQHLLAISAGNVTWKCSNAAVCLFVCLFVRAKWGRPETKAGLSSQSWTDLARNQVLHSLSVGTASCHSAQASFWHIERGYHLHIARRACFRPAESLYGSLRSPEGTDSDVTFPVAVAHCWLRRRLSGSVARPEANCLAGLQAR